MTQPYEGEGVQGTPTQEAMSATRGASETLQHLTSSARVSAVFGEPQTIGGRTVIPVADVFCTLGFGMGAGGGKAKEGSEAGFGSGGGGGGMARGRPVAAVVVEPEGVYVRSIVDVTQVSLAALAAGALVLLWMRRFLGPAKELEGDAALPSAKGLRKLFRHC